MGEYVITRVACKNPAIQGRALYLTPIGLWTLDPERAQRFTKREAMRVNKHGDRKWRIEPVAALQLARGEKGDE